MIVSSLTVIEPVEEVTILTGDAFTFTLYFQAMGLGFGAFAVGHGKVSIHTDDAITLIIVPHA